MNLPTLTREQVRNVDRRAMQELGMSGLVLMENAGRGCVEVLLAEQLPEPFLICCGKGNNAGDGFVIARHLTLRGKGVRVLLWTSPSELTGDAAANFRILKKGSTKVGTLAECPTADEFAAALASAGTVVDALLGTGATGDPRPPLSEVIAKLNESPAKRVAVDVPSGLDCDTGLPGTPTFRADHTITFVAPKPGLLLDSARCWVGRLHVADIGVPLEWLESSSAKK